MDPMKLAAGSERAPLSAVDALTVFGDAGAHPEARSDALTVLITAKLLPKEAEHPAVLAGCQHLLQQAHAGADSGYRLLAMAELVRFGQVVKRWAVRLPELLWPLFAQPLPAVAMLGRADDRLNLARACSLMAARGLDWLPAYLADAIADEDSGEKARAELLQALMRSEATLSAVFARLCTAFGRVRPGTESPGDTVARRLTRTLAALRPLLLDSDLETGESLGEAMHDLVVQAFDGSGRPGEGKVQTDLSRELLLAVHDTVRSRLSAVADAQLYQVIRYCRRLCGGGAWPAELRPQLDRLVADVSEALVLLGRQGQCHQGLLDQLEVLCDHAERARALAQGLASRHPELPEEVREWLRKGRHRMTRPASQAAQDAATSTADESLGLALPVAREARRVTEGLRPALMATLELYEPNLLPAVNELWDKVRHLTLQVEQAAALRALGTLGVPGEVMDMSTKYFNSVTGGHEPRMTVVVPAIVRMKTDGSPGEVVTKGLMK